MPLPDDVPPGRASELVEELGRVTVTSAAGATYAVGVDRRRILTELLVGATLGWGVALAVLAVAPWPPASLLGPVLGAVVWAGRHPLAVTHHVDVTRLDPDGPHTPDGGAVARFGVRGRGFVPAAVDAAVAAVRVGTFDATEGRRWSWGLSDVFPAADPPRPER